jgi:predicted HAD superfamily hydrolase
LTFLEWQEEQKYILPIKQNLDMLSEDTLVVSDTFYDRKNIKELLQAAGYFKDVNIIASNSGKFTLSVWKYLKKEGIVITHHTGDNYWSDVLSPKISYKTLSTSY